jgi:type II secretory pathway pseudopilin PulG
MKKQKRKKRAVTLVEIMIVIFLIGLIGGALAFNMRGSMDQGRVFKSQQNCQRVQEALMLANATGEFNLSDLNNMKKVKTVLKNTSFIKDPEKLLKDGWGESLKFRMEGDDLVVYSEKADAWKAAHTTK